MLIMNQRYQFIQAFIDKYAPKSKGVYVFYDGNGNIMYYGKADKTTVHAKLCSHLAGNDGKCTQNAISFSWTLTAMPDTVEIQLLEEFKRTMGRLPKCNAG